MNIYELEALIGGMRHGWYYSSVDAVRKALDHYCPGVSSAELGFDLNYFGSWHPGKFPRVARYTIDIPLGR